MRKLLNSEICSVDLQIVFGANLIAIEICRKTTSRARPLCIVGKSFGANAMHRLGRRIIATVPVDPFHYLADRRVELLLDVLTLAGDDFEYGVVQFGPVDQERVKPIKARPMSVSDWHFHLRSKMKPGSHARAKDVDLRVFPERDGTTECVISAWIVRVDAHAHRNCEGHKERDRDGNSHDPPLSVRRAGQKRAESARARA